MSRLTRTIRDQLKTIGRPIIKKDERWYTTNDLQLEIKKIQGMMLQAGVRKGDRILLGLPNSYSFLCVFLAIIDYGAVVATVNPKMTRDELERFIQRCRPVSGFVHEQHAAVIMECEQQHSFYSLFVYRDGLLDMSGYLRRRGNWLTLLQTDDVLNYRITSEPSEQAIATLLYTSGTTGAPKPVGLSHQQVIAAAQNIIASHALTERDLAYSVLPLFHINAQVVSVLSTILSGGRLIIAPKFSASRFWKVIASECVTWVSAVPAIITILLQTEMPANVPASLRFVRSASAPLAKDLQQKFEQTFNLPLIQSYGMTEAASQICVNPLPPKQQVPGSVGIPYGLELKIIDDAHHELPAGEIGEIIIRGDNVITRYEDGSGSDSFTHDWFLTGDVGYIDENGYVFIVGRKKELINHGGEKVSPYEVEQVIRQIAGVRQAAVIGLEDPKYGERVAAFVVSETEQGSVSQNQLKTAILAHCRESLSLYKWPETLSIIDNIPTGPTGKVQRSLLKRKLLQNQQGKRGMTHA